MNNAIPIKIANLGFLTGRDAIYLDKVNFNYEKNSIKFAGEFNTNLASDYSGDKDFLQYTLKFYNVLYMEMIELDFFNNIVMSSFDQINESELVSGLVKKDHSSKITIDHQEFVFSTYDDVFRIVSEGYKCLLKK